MLQLTRTLIYDKCRWVCSDIQPDKESAAYNGCRFVLNGRYVVYREAKITPSKPGLFVTIWKRNEKGITAPLDMRDGVDLVVISVQKGDQSGQFIFPAAVLLGHSILSGKGKDGKRGIRVYPPWEHDLNKQATKTQQWQVDYFLQMDGAHTDITKAKILYGLNQDL